MKQSPWPSCQKRTTSWISLGFARRTGPEAGKLTSDSIISPAQRSNRESRSEHLNVKQVETHSIVSIVLFGICLTVGWVAVATDKKLGK